MKQREEEWRAKKGRVQGAALDVTDDPALKKWIDGFATEGGVDHFREPLLKRLSDRLC